MPSPTTASCPVPPAAAPWWRFGHVWLVLALPVLAVLASLAGAYLALTRPDPVLPIAAAPRTAQSTQAAPAAQRAADGTTERTPERTPERSAAAAAPPLPARMLPALLARNHASTGGQPRP